MNILVTNAQIPFHLDHKFTKYQQVKKKNPSPKDLYFEGAIHFFSAT